MDYTTRIETSVPAPNNAWRRSTFGADHQIPVTLALADFAAYQTTASEVEYMLPGGTPLARKADGQYEPFATGKTLAGFLGTDRRWRIKDPKQATTEGSMQVMGIIRVQELPEPARALITQEVVNASTGLFIIDPTKG